MSVLFYRRPDYINPPSQPLNSNACARYVEKTKGSNRAIPEGLSFEEVIANKALPPCSLSNFMDYLIYVEHNAENLQFFLWYKDYCQRWEHYPERVRKLSPPWQFQKGAPKLKQLQENAVKVVNRTSRFFTKNLGDDWDINLFEEPQDGPGVRSDGSSFVASSFQGSFAPSNAEASAQAGLKWQPFSIQPSRDECNSVIRHYLAFNAPRELNLSHKDRTATLHALQHTTHPSAFSAAVAIAEATLRGQSHQNFVRWSICNGNKPRVFFVRTMGIQTVLFGFIIATSLTLSKVSRWWRIFAALMWFMGFSTLIAAYKGLCVILHSSHSRDLRPWEHESDAGAELGQAASTHSFSGASIVRGHTSRASSENSDYEDYKCYVDSPDSLRLRPDSQRTFGSRNDWVNAEWVSKYEKKNIISKIFEKNVWTQNEALKVLQDKIVLGANIWALIITVPLTAGFVALPNGNFF